MSIVILRVAAAFVVHMAAIGVGCAEFGGAEFFSLRGGVVLLVGLAAGAYLLVQRFYHQYKLLDADAASKMRG